MAAAARRRGRRPRAGAGLLRRRGLVLLGRDPGGRPGQQGAGPAGARHRGPGRRRRLDHPGPRPGLATGADPSRHLGLRWADGYGRLGAILAQGPDRVERAFTRLEGTPPRAGEGSAVEGYAFPADPALAAGRPAHEVTYPSPLGPAAAWRVGGRRDTWVILVHGYNAARTETLRTLATVSHRATRRWPSPTATTRARPAPRRPAPLGGDRVARPGGGDPVRARPGAGGVVLAGFSMGGAVVTSFLLESPLASRVRGVVLDSPALDLGEVIDHGATDRDLPVLGTPVPPALTVAAKGIAGVRYDLDWAELDYLDRAGRLAAPMLVFQQSGDPTVPVTISEQLAAARSDLVTFERFAGDGHVQSWNTDRARYERAVRAFLERVAPAGAPDPGA